jgi:hypothetical protein
MMVVEERLGGTEEGEILLCPSSGVHEAVLDDRANLNQASVPGFCGVHRWEVLGLAHGVRSIQCTPYLTSIISLGTE